jgi:Flp pilus assembly protein TadG
MHTKSKHRRQTRTHTHSTSERTATRRRSDRGVSSLEVALMLPFLLLLLMGVLDFGQLFYLAIEVSDAARAGAQYGYQNLTTQMDTSGMIAAAEDDAVDVSSWGTNVASYGCMCSDGTDQAQLAASASSCAIQPSACTSKGAQLVDYVQVQTQAIYAPILPLPGLPSSITLNGNATYWAPK